MNRQSVHVHTVAQFIALALALSFFSGCDDCQNEKVASLLLPPAVEDAANPTLVTYREIDGDITCLDSRFFNISDSWTPVDVQTDFESLSGDTRFGSYLAAGMIVRSDAAVAALMDLGCLDTTQLQMGVDFTTQTLVIVHVTSDEGCPESFNAVINQTSDGIAQMNIHLTYTPSAGCSFEFSRAFVVDQPNARAHLTITAGCAEPDPSAEI